MALRSVCLQNVATPLAAPTTGCQQSSLLAQTSSAPQRIVSKKAIRAVHPDSNGEQNDKRSNNAVTAATRLALIGYASASLAFGHVHPSHAAPESAQALKDRSVQVAEETRTAGLENNLRGQENGNSTTPQLPNPEDVTKGLKDIGGLFNKGNVGVQGERSEDVVSEAGDAAKGKIATGDVSKPTFGPFSNRDFADKASNAASEAGNAVSGVASDVQSKTGPLGGIGDQAQAALSNLAAPVKGLTGQADLPSAEGAKNKAQGAFDDVAGRVQSGIGGATNKQGNLSLNNVQGDARGAVEQAQNVLSDLNPLKGLTGQVQDNADQAKRQVGNVTRSGDGDREQNVFSDLTGGLKNLTGQTQGNLGGNAGDIAGDAGRQAQGAADNAKGKAQGAFGEAKRQVGNLPGGGAAGGDIRGTAQSIVSKAGTLSKDILGNIRSAASDVQSTVSDATGGLGGGLPNPAKGIQKQFQGAASNAQSSVQNFGGNTQGNSSTPGGASGNYKDEAKNSTTSRRNAFDLKKGGSGGNAQSSLSDASDVLSGLPNPVKGIQEQAQGVLGGLPNPAKDIQGQAQSVLGGLSNPAKDLQGLQGQAEGAASKAQSSVKDFGGDLEANSGGPGGAPGNYKNEAKNATTGKRNAFDLKKGGGSGFQNSGEDVLGAAKGAFGQ